jgi:hypothetical protein
MSYYEYALPKIREEAARAENSSDRHAGIRCPVFGDRKPTTRTFSDEGRG